MEIDLHGYHPRDIVWSGVLAKVVQQAWEMGESHLCFIHGHGRNRGITPGFVNTNTGYFGLEIRRALRHEPELRQWILHTTLDCEHPGCTTVKLMPNGARLEQGSTLISYPEGTSSSSGGSIVVLKQGTLPCNIWLTRVAYPVFQGRRRHGSRPKLRR